MGLLVPHQLELSSKLHINVTCSIGNLKLFSKFIPQHNITKFISSGQPFCNGEGGEALVLSKLFPFVLGVKLKFSLKH